MATIFIAPNFSTNYEATLKRIFSVFPVTSSPWAQIFRSALCCQTQVLSPLDQLQETLHGTKLMIFM
jgi:hypothetical protein